MKIIVYTVTDCKFSQAEKEYLKSHNLPFEERNLETKHEYLSEMLTISDNFAGTPVTVIEKDQEDKGPQIPSGDQKPEDAQAKDNAHKIVLKGFTEEEFDKALGFTEAEGKEAEKKEPEAKKPEEAAKETPQDKNQPEQSTAPAQAQQQPAPTQPNTPAQPVAPQPPQQQAQQQTTAPQGMPDAPNPSMPQNPPVPPPAPAQPAAPQQQPQQQAQQVPQQPQIEVDPSLPGVPDAPSNVTDDSLDAILKDLQVKANEADQ